MTGLTPRTSPIRIASRARFALLPILLAGSVALGAVEPADVAAHAELVSSDPAANSTLPAAPERVRLTFTEAVDPSSASVRLLDARQAEVAGLGEVRTDGAGTTVSVDLPELEPGVYTVAYQVTSAVDGHVTSGILAFLVDPTGTQPAPGVSSESDTPSSSLEATVARWVGLASALALAGVIIFWLLAARPALADAGRRLRAPWVAIVVAGLLAAGGLTAYLILAARPILGAGTAPADAFPLDPAGPFGTTQFAIAMRLALLGMVAAALLGVAGLGFWRHERAWLTATLLAACAGLAGMSFAGHAAATGGPLYAVFDLLHLLGVAAWVGTLIGLGLFAWNARDLTASALRRHSRVALAAAPVVVLTGIANSPLVLGIAARDLVASDYGNLLLAKALLVAVALGIGAANHFLIRRDVAVPALLGAELLIGAVAVLAAAGLVTGQPAGSRPPVLTRSAIGAAHLYGTTGESAVHAAVNLPSPGPQRYQVAVTDPQTGAYRSDVQRVFLRFVPPRGAELAEERVQLEPSNDAGLWGTAGAYTPVIGQWELEVIVRRAGELDESVSFPLDVVEPLPPQQVPPPDTGTGVPVPLALLWAVLPGGVAGWGLPAGLLVLAAVAFALGRRSGPAHGVAFARATAVVLAIVIGLGVGSRELVSAANAPPADEAAQSNPVEPDAESIDRGEGLYAANCVACHGADGAGDGPAASGILPPLAPLAERVPDMTDGALAYRIAVGTAGTRMPAFAATISERDRWDIVNYLRSRWPR
ncbi:MAG TPA: copper resistance protein CopC [Candidatus Limnocylindria bacterium]|nr:copper resistance protein CopC [Candidatus Limnocylindria bacterium]